MARERYLHYSIQLSVQIDYLDNCDVVAKLANKRQTTVTKRNKESISKKKSNSSRRSSIVSKASSTKSAKSNARGQLSVIIFKIPKVETDVKTLVSVFNIILRFEMGKQNT